MEIVEIDVAAPQLDALIERVLGGEPIYLARSGRVLVHLAPLGATPRRRPLGALRGPGEVPDDAFAPPENELAASAETSEYESQLTEEQQALLNDINQAAWNRVRHLFEFPD